MSAKNEEVVRRAVEALAVGAGHLPDERHYEEVYASKVLEHPWWHGPVDPLTLNPAEVYEATPELFRQGHVELLARFQQARTTVDELLCVGDRVIVRYTTTAIHRTGKPLSYRSLDIYRLHEGKIVEIWNTWDRLGVVQQLGLVPDSLALMEQEQKL